jgi:DNA-binding transcriptional ArsR family regulator
VKKGDKDPPPIIIPAWLDDAGLRPASFRVLCRVARRDGKDGCFESIPLMAKGCRLKESTVREALKDLIEAGLIEANRRDGETTVHRIVKNSQNHDPY